MAMRNACLCAVAQQPEAQGFEALVLAQCSMAPAREGVQDVVRCPVLTNPSSAVRALRARLR
jgi:hypothetical protein